VSETKTENICYQKKENDEKHVVPSLLAAEMITQGQASGIGIVARGCNFMWMAQLRSPDQCH